MVSTKIEGQVIRLRSLLTALRTLISAVEAGESDFAASAYGSMLFLISEIEQTIDVLDQELSPSAEGGENDA
jgi:hypothetical protein